MYIKKDLEIKAISNSEYIEKLFKRLSKKKTIDTLVNLEDGESKSTTLEFKRKEAFLTDTTLKLQHIKLTFIFNGYAYYFFSKADELLKIERPKTLYLLTKRELERHIIKEDEKAYAVINKQQYRILNIHTKGLAFEVPKKSIIKNDLIRNLTINLDDTTIFVDAEVRHIEKKDKMYIYGLNFKDINWIDKIEIVKYIIRTNHTHLANMSDYSSDELYELFDKSGYFGLLNNAFESDFSDMISTLRKIDKVPHLSKSFVYVNDNKQILSGANIVKLYDYTFLAQHLAVKKEAKHNLACKMDIYKAVLDYVLNHHYFKYYLAYFDRDLDWHRGLYQKIIEYINDPKKLVFEELIWFAAWTSDSTSSDKNNPYTIEKLYDFGEFLDYANKNLSDLEKGCYCYNEDIHLEKIKNLYELKDLYAERKIYKVTENGNISAYLVAEVYSSGLNLFNSFDSVKIYFTHTNIDPSALLNALYGEMNNFYQRYNKNYFHIIFNLNCGIDFDNINIKNFKRVPDTGRVIANTDGAKEYQNYFKTVLR